MKKLIFFVVTIIMSYSVIKNVKADVFHSEGYNYFNYSSYEYENGVIKTDVSFEINQEIFTAIIVDGGNPDTNFLELFKNDGIIKPYLKVVTNKKERIILFQNAFDNYSGALCYATFIPDDGETIIKSIEMSYPKSWQHDFMTLRNHVYMFSSCYDAFDIDRTEYYDLDDEQAPILSGESVYLVDYDRPVSKEKIKESLSATDNIDGDLTNMIKIKSSTYEMGCNVGSYQMIFNVFDSSNNEGIYELIVRVVDITPPVITGESNITIYENSDLSNEFFISKLKVEDNTDLKPKLTVKSSNLENKSGEYIMVFQATDLYGNQTEFEMNIKVLDSIPPVIKGDDYIVSKFEADSLSIDGVKNMIENRMKSDGVEYSNLKIVTDEYTGFENVKGEYKVEFTFNDEEDNYCKQVVRIKVLEDVVNNSQIDIPTTKNDSSVIIISIVTSVLFVLCSIGLFFYIKIKKRTIK